MDGWIGWDWLSYTAVTPRASLQSDANNKAKSVDIYLSLVSFAKGSIS